MDQPSDANAPIDDIENLINELWETGPVPTAYVLNRLRVDVAPALHKGTVRSAPIRSLRTYAYVATRSVGSPTSQFDALGDYPYEEGAYSTILGPRCEHPDIQKDNGERYCTDCKKRMPTS